MWDNPDYVRVIRAPDGKTFHEVFKSDVDDINGYQTNTYVLESMDMGTQGHIVAKLSWRHVTASGETKDHVDTMPKWWSEPDPMAVAKKYQAADKKILPTTRNVVTFVTYMADGRMQLQQHSYVSPQGKLINNPGYLSINGGLMESDNVEENLRREAMEELGVTLTSQFAKKVGDVYDAEAGRSNHVFRLTTGYDTLLTEQFSVAEAVKALCNPEGLGRSFVWRGDLEAIMAAKALTGISVKILEAFPELMPPSRS